MVFPDIPVYWFIDVLDRDKQLIWKIKARVEAPSSLLSICMGRSILPSAINPKVDQSLSLLVGRRKEYEWKAPTSWAISSYLLDYRTLTLFSDTYM